MAGRATRTRLLPFSLAEVCQELRDRPPRVRERLTEERFARHVLVGGYPEVWLSDTPEVLLTDLLVNTGLDHKEEIQGAQVQWIRPWDLAERVRSLLI